MRLSVATNFDDDLLTRIAGFPVEDVYGKLSEDPVGGGRAGFSTGKTDRAKLERHLRTAHSHGIKFNYLLNASCLGNREWTREGAREIREILDYLVGIGVDSVTVSIPSLAETVKRHYPGLGLKIGIFANIDTPFRARFWEDLGADTLVLESFSINRSFSRLKNIRSAVRCRLQLIANFSCLPNCPMQGYHMNGISHGSSPREKAPFIDYCILKCTEKTLEDPVTLIRSNWIRPEDTGFYEGFGFSEFKLLERNAPTETMVGRVEAYARRRSPDNLLALIQPFGYPGKIRMSYGWLLPVLFHRPRILFDMYRLLKRRGMLFPLEGTPVVLDSRKIPADFLSQIEGRPCSTDHDCRGCGYCPEIAAKAYRVDPDYRAECLNLYKKVLRKLC